MANKRKQRLTQLGTESLTDALLSLAERDPAAEDLIDRLIATPEENIQCYKSKLSRLKRSRRFIDWRQAADFAKELENLLEDMKAGVDAPCTGAKLTTEFYQTDKATLGNSDDSSGYIGDVYRYDAKMLFVEYASQCKDKKWLVSLVFKLNREDDYGVRDALIDCAVDYLPEDSIRTLIAEFQAFADKASEEFKKRHCLHLIELLARQIKDAPLFEKTRLASWGGRSTAACIDIARVYLESDDARSALVWLDQIAATESFKADERDKLLLAVYENLDDKENQAQLAWRIFRGYRNIKTLEKLLTIIGAEQKNTVIADELSSIMRKKALCLTDVIFLTEVGCFSAVEIYLLDRRDQLNGDFYSPLLSLAETMESEGFPLAAVVLYRALLDSILRRAKSKTYTHGVRYLKKLDKLAEAVSDWQRIESHVTYTEHLHHQHGRKKSFWSRYEN